MENTQAFPHIQLKTESAIHPARQGVFESPESLLSCLLSCFKISLRGPRPRVRFLPRSPQPLFCSFCCWKSEMNSSLQVVPKRSQKEGPKITQNHKSLLKLVIKTHPPARPANRVRLGGSKPLKLKTLTRFLLVFQRPGSPKKDSKWEAT